MQLLGDGKGGLVHLHERECSVQRRRQKLIEACPALGLSDTTLESLYAHALAMGSACGYRSAGTCEFLVDRTGDEAVFLEFNPRVQVEHTVSEEATGVDIVRTQLLVAGGATLEGLGLTQDKIRLTSAAMQARVQMTAAGRVGAYAEPGGPGVRVDGCVYAGYEPPTMYDPLLLKVIARAETIGRTPAESLASARKRLQRACAELHLGGTIQANVAELTAILASPIFARGEWTTDLLDEPDGGRLLDGGRPPSGAHEQTPIDASASRTQLLERSAWTPTAEAPAVAADEESGAASAMSPPPEGCHYVLAPVSGEVVDAPDAASPGSSVAAGAAVLVLSSMKMEVRLPFDSKTLLWRARPAYVLL